RAPAAWRTWLYRRGFEMGPVAGQTGLPYGAGVRLQRMLLRLPAVQARYPRSVARLCEWHELLQDSVSVRDATLVHLMANTWQGWRAQALAHLGRAFDRWVHVEGREHLAAALASARGVILVSPHTPLMRVLRALPEWQGRESMAISVAPGFTATERADLNHPQRVARRAEQLMQAHRLLARRGVVRIAGDGPAGVGGVLTTVGDRQLEIRFGVGEVAAATGACVLPAFAWMQPNGQITFHICPPVVPEDFGAGKQDARRRIEGLTAHYAQLYRQFWPRQYAAMEWGFLAMYLALPRAAQILRKS
ncbi:MAG: hypothetical protein WDZ49_12185, partial [Litorilinea sp.]